MNALHQIGEPLLAESGGSPSFCTGSPAESCTTEDYASSNSGDAADGPDSGCVQSSLVSDSVEEEQTAAENQPCGGTGLFRYHSDSASGQVRNNGLSKGMRVEVCSSEEGYAGAWFEGVILTFTTSGRRCKIRYDKFVTDEGKPLVEEVWLHSEVRPIPPHIQLPLHCSVGDVVEAYDTDCWWRGVIVKACEGAEEDLWVVYFPDTDTLKAYAHSELRPAQEWLRGEWILAPQDRSPVIEEVIQSLSVEKTKESRGISGGKDVGKKKREAVKCRAASGQTKRLKVIVSGRVYVREIVQEGSKIVKSRDGTRPEMENDE